MLHGPVSGGSIALRCHAWVTIPAEEVRMRSIWAGRHSNQGQECLSRGVPFGMLPHGYRSEYTLRYFQRYCIAYQLRSISPRLRWVDRMRRAWGFAVVGKGVWRPPEHAATLTSSPPSGANPSFSLGIRLDKCVHLPLLLFAVTPKRAGSPPRSLTGTRVCKPYLTG